MTKGGDGCSEGWGSLALASAAKRDLMAMMVSGWGRGEATGGAKGGSSLLILKPEVGQVGHCVNKVSTVKNSTPEQVHKDIFSREITV